MADVGLTHIVLLCTDPNRSIEFYTKYAAMEVVHRRVDADSGATVIWLSDRKLPFVIVLIQAERVTSPLLPLAHLGVGCATRDDVDRLCARARAEECLRSGPTDSGYPVGYWALLADPDGNTLELSHGQEVALALARGESD